MTTKKIDAHSAEKKKRGTLEKKKQLVDKVLAMPPVDIVDIEAARYFPAEGTPPPKPSHFDKRYVLPKHRDKHLQHKFAHWRDANMTFLELFHIYNWMDTPVEVSVSSVLPETAFDPTEAIAMMINGRQPWPRYGYVKNIVPVLDDSAPISSGLGALLYCENTDSTVASVAPCSGGGDLRLQLRKDATKRRYSGALTLYTFTDVLTDDEIRQKWDANGEDARNRGTEAHLQMELWFNSEPCRIDDPEVIVGLKFVRDCLLPIQAKPYRTEWEIYATEEDVAGSIDLAVVLPDKTIVLIDWKRSEKLPKKMRGYSRLPDPLGHLDDCAGVRYAVQLSLYQFILEKYYGCKVVGRALASLHPETPFCTSVPYMRDEVEYLMAKRRARVDAKRKIAENPAHAHLLCSHSKMLCTDAVRDEAGQLYHQKVALVQNMTNTVRDKAVEGECETLIAVVAEEPTFHGGTSWKSLMPVGGITDILLPSG